METRVAEAGEGLVGKGDDGSGWNAPFQVVTIAVVVAFRRTNSNETTKEAQYAVRVALLYSECIFKGTSQRGAFHSGMDQR